MTVVGAEHELNEITGFVLNSCEKLTAVSEFLRNSARAVYHIDRDIAVLPNFVDTRRFSPERRDPARRRELAPGGEPLVGHMSNFRPVKRVRDVLTAFRTIHERTGARLVLIGDGAELPETRAWLAEQGLAEHAVLTGALREVQHTLAQLDVFLLPSQTESFGLAALEAMACGVPVVTSNAGGLPEVVRDGVDGLLVPVGDVAGLADAALRILGDPGLHAAMSASARERAVVEFDTPLVVGRYETLYREVAAATQSSRLANGGVAPAAGA